MASAAPAGGQVADSSDARWYDFWPGAWYEVTESGTAELPTFVVRRDVHPAAYLEEWRIVVDGSPSRSTGLRVWDREAGRWTLFWVSDLGHVQLWLGSKVQGNWVITRPFEQEGRRFVSRQSWIPEGPDRVVRTIERSFDEGRTWETRLRETYARGPMPGPPAEGLETGRGAPPPADATALFRAIHDRYVGKRFTSVTFVQRTESADGSVELWYEAIRPFGLVRVDIAPLDEARGFMYRGDSLYTFEAGHVARAKGDERWITMLALVDVYAQPVDATLDRLRSLGVDLTTVHESGWEGRPAIVVGASAGDTTAAQIWYDREHLYPVRVIQPPSEGHPRVEFQISGHRFMEGGWIESRIEIFVGGRRVTTECYGEIRPHAGLDEGLFDPHAFLERRWAETAYPDVDEPPAC